jgi:hypothetical protein
MEPALSSFIDLYMKLGNVIQDKYPDNYQRFSKFRSAIAFKMQLLEMIILRYEKSKKLYDAWMQEAQEKLKLYSTSADPEILREADAFSRRGDFARRSIILDIESFLVFSRVMRDNIPWMFQPFFRGIHTINEPRTTDFRLFCDWFEENQEDVLDKEFLEFILEFRNWFYVNLRNPRNELVIHLERHYTLDSFSSDGKIMRMKYSIESGPRDTPESKFQLESPPILYEKLLKFHRALEKLFLEKM